MENIINLEEKKGPAKPLLEIIKESMKLMRDYLDLDDKCEVITDGQPVDVHVYGPPNYKHVLQTIEATSESQHSYFRQLGALVPQYISKKEFERLFNEYEELRLECGKHWESLR